jgi:rod shape-determining protein MreC
VIKLLNYIIEIRDAFVLVICILLSLLLMITTDKDPGGSFRGIALDVLGGVGQYVYRVQSYFDLTDENKVLRKENTDLAFKNMQLQDALLENIRLRKLLGFREKTQMHLTAAEVIGQNPHSIVNGLLLNAGSDIGIRKSAAVLTADGLVGKVIEVDEDHAICQILFDPTNRVSAKIQRNREFGIIAWDGATQLKLLYIAKTIKVYIGDVIVTSGMSQIFPENIKIGIVVDVSMENEGMFQEILVNPTVNFNRLEEVQVHIEMAKNAS